MEGKFVQKMVASQNTTLEKKKITLVEWKWEKSGIDLDGVENI